MMMRYWQFFVAIGALLFQTVPVLFIRLAARTAYGESPWIPESWVWPVSLVGLTLCAMIGITLANGAIYGLLTRFRLRVAIPFIILCCIPALISAMVYLRAVLVFVALG